MSSVFYNTDGAYKDGNPLLQEHIGTVIDVNDPLNLCRVRVYIPNLLGYDNLSWISRVSPTFYGVTYSVPRLGDRIRVWFRNNNIMDGIYGLDYTHKDERLKEFSPNEYGFIDNNGNKLKINNTSTSYKTNNINIESKTITANVDNFIISGNLSVGTGYTGSFSTKDGFTVTVMNGIITDIS